MMIFGKKEQKSKFIFDFICFRGETAPHIYSLTDLPGSKEISDRSLKEKMQFGDNQKPFNGNKLEKITINSRSTDNLLPLKVNPEETNLIETRESNSAKNQQESLKAIIFNRESEGFSLFDLFNFYKVINAEKWDSLKEVEEEAKQMARVVYSILDADGNKLVSFKEFMDFLNKNPSNIDFFNFVSGTKQTALQELKTDKRFNEISLSSKKAQKQLMKLGRLIFHPIHLEEQIPNEGVNFSHALNQTIKDPAESKVNLNVDPNYTKQKAYIKASLMGQSRPRNSILLGDHSPRNSNLEIPDNLADLDKIFSEEFVDKLNVYLHQYKKAQCGCNPNKPEHPFFDAKDKPITAPNSTNQQFQNPSNGLTLIPENYFDNALKNKDMTKKNPLSLFDDIPATNSMLYGNHLTPDYIDINVNQKSQTGKNGTRQVTFNPDVDIQPFDSNQPPLIDVSKHRIEYSDIRISTETNPLQKLWNPNENLAHRVLQQNQKKDYPGGVLEPMTEDPESQVFFPFSFAKNEQDASNAKGLNRSLKVQDPVTQTLQEFLKSILDNYYVLTNRLQTIEQMVEHEKNRSNNQNLTPNTLREADKKNKPTLDSRRNVFFKDKNWSIVTTMLLGMKHSLNFTSQDKYHKVAPLDYKLNNIFGIEAVYQSYFSHCRFTDYAPYVFAGMRRLFNIKQEDYLNSIGLNNFSSAFFDKLYVMLCEQSSGKSGSFFFYSHDNKYLVKTISKMECEKFYEILPKYYAYFADCDKNKKRTLLSRFFGLHRVECLKNNRLVFDVYVLIMNNIFSTPDTIDHKYDLKGSTYKRLTLAHEIEKKAALKDLNFKNARKADKNFGFHIGDLRRTEILDQMNLDVKFLAECNIIDYSLMVGVVNDPHVLTNPDDPSRHLVERKQVAKDDTIVVFDVKNGQRYYIGIIDTLTNFGAKKRTEAFFKRLFCGSGVSAIPPKSYAERFIRFMESALN